jgi:hypothetical protein
LVGAGVGEDELKNLSCNPAGRLQDKPITPIRIMIPVRIKAFVFLWGEIIGQFPFSNSTVRRFDLLDKEIITLALQFRLHLPAP